MTIPMLVAALNGKKKTVPELVRIVAPRLHEVSPIAQAAAPGEGQRGHYWIHGGHVDASLGVWYEREYR